MFDYKESNSDRHFGLYENGELVGIVELETADGAKGLMDRLVSSPPAGLYRLRQQTLVGAQDDLPCPYCRTQNETNILEVDMEHHYEHYREADLEQMDATCIVYFCFNCDRVYQFNERGELVEI